jgi:hypothetical protein
MSDTSPWAYTPRDGHTFEATAFTIGPWSPGHQHAGPPSALVCRAIERLAAESGLTHVGRLTGNLLRPVPLGEMRVEVAADYVGKSAGHYSARLLAAGKEVARYTALVQREDTVPVPPGTLGHPLPAAPPAPADCPPVRMPFAASTTAGYGHFVENRLVAGQFFHGPCTAWFRMRHPLVAGEPPSPYQRVVVAADSGNGISAALSFDTHLFVNSDLTVNLLRRPRGEWVCLEARTALGGNGCGLAESVLYDEEGLIGRATQSLAVRARG